MPDAGDAISNRDALQASAVSEGTFLNASDAIWDRETRQAGAAIEGITLDAGDAIRNRDARQAGAAREGTCLNAGDAVRDVVIGTCLACRIEPPFSPMYSAQIRSSRPFRQKQIPSSSKAASRPFR